VFADIPILRLMSATQADIRVLPAERGWARNLGRQAGIATFVLGMAVTHWSTAFGLTLAGTVVATMALMRGASNYQRSRFRRQPDHALASRNGIAGELWWDGEGIRWAPRKPRSSTAPIGFPWSQIDYLTVQRLTGLIDACRLVVEPDTEGFVITAPVSEVELQLKKSVEQRAR
jgi:hypothetical protein